MFRRKLRPGRKLCKLKTVIVAEKPVYQGRSKDIRAKWHFIRKRVEQGMARLVDIRTEFMGADMMTKSARLALQKVNMKLIEIFSGYVFS